PPAGSGEPPTDRSQAAGRPQPAATEAGGSKGPPFRHHTVNTSASSISGAFGRATRTEKGRRCRPGGENAHCRPVYPSASFGRSASGFGVADRDHLDRRGAAAA